MMSCDKNDAENTMEMQDAVKITTKGLFREEFDMLLSQKVQFSHVYGLSLRVRVCSKNIPAAVATVSKLNL
jgi:hypothetical protein